MKDDQKQEVITDEADGMQQFYYAHHNRGDNLPCPEETAESALEEPNRKAAKHD